MVERAAPSVVAVEVRGARAGGTGSGVLITPDGYAVTNHHVIAAGGNVRMHLPDGRIVAAPVVGGDPATDIALLRAHASALEFATLGSTKAIDADAVCPCVECATNRMQPSHQGARGCQRPNQRGRSAATALRNST